jgi:hypothetical protein
MASDGRSFYYGFLMENNTSLDGDKKYTVCPTIEDKDIYKYVLDTRNFEISLFWQRSNYFLVLNSALAVGFFSLKSHKLMFLLAALGLLSSFLWYLVVLGSKYWQSRWEYQLQRVEELIAPDLGLFAADRSSLDEDVKNSLEFNKHRGIQKWLDGQILKKPSVSYSMTFLTFIFMIGWLAVACVALLPPINDLRENAKVTSQPASISNGSNTPSIVPISTTQQSPLPPTQTASPSININISVSDGVHRSQPMKKNINPNEASLKHCP